MIMSIIIVIPPPVMEALFVRNVSLFLITHVKLITKKVTCMKVPSIFPWVRLFLTVNREYGSNGENYCKAHANRV